MTGSVRSATYTLAEHHHRLAAWDASRGASASPLCRFSVKRGFELLEAVGFTSDFSSPDFLPAPRDVDRQHRKWRRVVIAKAAVMPPLFSHGVAAKLINCYLKARFVCGGHGDHPRVTCLHPPIDRLLLDELQKRNVGGRRREWRAAKEKGWSKFTSEDYEGVIGLVRDVMDDQPLWMIEKHWRGYQ